MVEHISSFQGIVNKLVAMKMNIDDEMQTSLLLSSLLDGWETLVVVVKDSLLNEEVRRKEKVNLFLEYLFMKKQERQEKPKRHGRSQSRNSHGFRGRSKSIKYIKCYHCNKVGHMKKECRIWKKEHNEVINKIKRLIQLLLKVIL